MEERHLTTAEVSALLRITTVYVARLRKQGKGPPFIQVSGHGGRVLYPESGLRQYLAERVGGRPQEPGS